MTKNGQGRPKMCLEDDYHEIHEGDFCVSGRLR